MNDHGTGLIARLAAGEVLSDAEAIALAGSTDILTLGMLADDARRRRHGPRTTYVRVVDLQLPEPGEAFVIPPSAREVRVVASVAALEANLPVLGEVTQAAGDIPVSACSLADLQRHARATGATLAGLLRGLRHAGVTLVAEAPLDEVDELEQALEEVRDAGLGLARLTVRRQGDAAARIGLIRRASEVQHALGWLRSFAPLPRSWSASSPTTGYDDVRQVALARLLADNIPSIQVDWALYGPKLAQVALTVGADDLDAVSAFDDESEGRRRAPLEEARRNILAAALEPVERDGDYRRIG